MHNPIFLEYGFTDFEDFSFTPLHDDVDASGASDPDDRRSTSGIVFYLEIAYPSLAPFVHPFDLHYCSSLENDG